MIPNQCKWTSLFDKVPVMEVNGSEALLTFLASHYVFIICYSRGLETMHIFKYIIYMDCQSRCCT